jgi:hypothetical protein
VTQSRAQAAGSRSELLPQVVGEVQDFNEVLNLKTFGLTLPGVPTVVGPFKRSWAHRQSLLAHVSMYDPTVRERVNAIVQGLLARSSTLLEAQRQAVGALEGMVVRQTFLLTYMDAFRIVGIFFLLCIPLLLLFKRVRRGGPVPATMH